MPLELGAVAKGEGDGFPLGAPMGSDLRARSGVLRKPDQPCYTTLRYGPGRIDTQASTRDLIDDPRSMGSNSVVHGVGR
jgi:hypothetical protein